MSTEKHPADVLASALLGNSELWHNLAPAAHQLRRIPALEKLAAERLAQMEADRKQALQWRDERDALRAQVEQARQPLTYDQIEAIFSESYGQTLQEHLTGCARAIERAHGIGAEGGAA